MRSELVPWGWSQEWESRAGSAELWVGRVIEESRDQYQVATGNKVVSAEVPGQFRYRAKQSSDYPVVGDWVVLQQRSGSERVLIQEVLPRHSKIGRKAAGEKDEEQILASNVDYACLVTSANLDLNIRRLERFFSSFIETHITPVIVLTKIDLVQNLDEIIDQLSSAFPQMKIWPVSSQTGAGLTEIEAQIKGKTLLLLGMSGVGKSTLTNSLLASDIQQTQEIREKDSRGRHTTTKRSLFRTAHGACIIDTPGIREMQIFDSEVDVESVFAEIRQLAAKCRFINCTHRTEPGCEVQNALQAGELSPERYQSFIKLLEETSANAQKYERLKEKKSRDEKNKLKGRSLRKNKDWKKQF